MSSISSMRNDEFEHREKHPDPTGLRRRDLLVRVSKTGGGTVGQAYEGTWLYRVSPVGRPDQILMEGDDLRTGTHKTHQQVVQLVLDFLPDETGEGR